MLTAVQHFWKNDEHEKLIQEIEEKRKKDEELKKQEELARVQSLFARARADFTPDIMDVEKKVHQPLFAYDTMQKGGSEHGLIEENILERNSEGKTIIYTAFTMDRYTLWKANRPGGASFPIPLKNGSPAATHLDVAGHRECSARIKGKLYFVRSTVFKELDKVRQNGILYHRQKVPILIPLRVQNGCQNSTVNDSRLTEEFVIRRTAWMYVGDTGYWEPHLDGGANFLLTSLFNPRPKVWLKEPFFHFIPWNEA